MGLSFLYLFFSSFSSRIYFVPCRTTCLPFAFPLSPYLLHFYRGILELYHISYLWVPVISFFVTVIVGIAITILSGLRNGADVDPNLVTPGLRTFYERTKKKASFDDTKLSKTKGVTVCNLQNEKNGNVNYGMTADDGTEFTTL